MEDVVIKIEPTQENLEEVSNIKQEICFEEKQFNTIKSDITSIEEVSLKTKYKHEGKCEEDTDFTFVDVDNIKNEVDIEEIPLLKREEDIDAFNNYLKSEKLNTEMKNQKIYSTENIFTPEQEKSNLSEESNISNPNEPDTKTYTCSICNKMFTIKNSFYKHKLIHSGEKMHDCNKCNKKFTQKSSLDNHKLLHTGEKPHECNVCDKKFTQKCSLIKHRLVHTGEKPHKCNICQKTFPQKFNLSVHMLIHTGERRFKCNICNKKFIQKVNLINHYTTHTGEKTNKFVEKT